MDEKRLGLKLQEARKAAGLTQQELCQKSGLSYSTLAKIERGAIKSPSIFTIQQIAGALSTTVDDLIGKGSGSSTKKRSKRGVTFVFFDINGCMVRFLPRAFTAAAADTGIASDIIELTFWRYNDKVCRGEMTFEEFNHKLAECFEVKSFDWAPYYLEAVESIPETVELVKWASQNYRIGLLSNIMPNLIPAMLDKGLLPEVDYDAIVDSSEVKAIKPEAKIYEIAAQQAGVDPSEILLVDDSPANVIAAEKMGWHVLLFHDSPEESVNRIKEALEF